MFSSLRVTLSMGLVGLVLICLLFFAYRYHSTTSANSLPAYFQSMEEGHQYEKKREYKRAIQLYRHALQQTPSVYPDLQQKSQVAVHNRIAACYRSMGQIGRAATEFRISVSLGDKKYAPHALAQLK